MTNYIDIPQKKTFADIGLDNFGQSPLLFEGTETNQKTASIMDSGVPSNFIQDGDMIVRLTVFDGYLQSPDFVTTVSGWQIKPDGVEFGTGYFRGDITGASGAFSGTISASNITAGTISSKAISLAVAAGTGDSYIAAGKTDFTNVDAGFILGLDDSDSDKAKFYMGDASVYFNWDGAALTVAGGVIYGGVISTATSGYRIRLNGATNKIELLNNDSILSTVYADAGGSLIMNSVDDIYFTKSGANMLRINSNGDLNIASSGSKLTWGSGRYLDDSPGDGLAINGIFASNQDNADSCGRSAKRWSNLYANNSRCNNYYSGDGSQGADSSAKDFVTTMRYDDGAIEYKTRSYTFKDGLMTSVGGESGWIRT